ncbi:MAG: HepT-like ribonuclease domain-containing protein [Actinomycetota bacterium]|nr:HepT-like ribonuclease domain-containing protein [Actinomycetota bacterium]
MIDAAEQIIRLTNGRTVAQLEGDRTVRDAVLWNFTVLGEAVNNLSSVVKGIDPTIEWGEPSRVRNRVVHGYWSADIEVLLATAQDDIPAFLEGVRDVQRRLGEATEDPA